MYLFSIGHASVENNDNDSFTTENEILEDIVVPCGVKNIGLDLFSGPTKMKRIVIPNSVLNINYGGVMKGGLHINATIYTDNLHIKRLLSRVAHVKNLDNAPDNMFQNKKHEYISTNNSIPHAISAAYVDAKLQGCIDISAFSGEPIVASFGFLDEHGITSIILPKNTTEICDGAFMYCKNLANINIPGTVSRIGRSAFACCRNLSTISIENGVIRIDPYAFEMCSKLYSIQIPSSVKYIGSCAFTQSGLKSVQIGSELTCIKSGTFSHCFNLESIDIPNNVMSIDGHAFYRCINLKNARLGKVKLIGECAFKGCKELRRVYLSNNITSIGAKAFAGCHKCIFYVHSKRVKNMLLMSGSGIKTCNIRYI